MEHDNEFPAHSALDRSVNNHLWDAVNWIHIIDVQLKSLQQHPKKPLKNVSNTFLKVYQKPMHLQRKRLTSLLLESCT